MSINRQHPEQRVCATWVPEAGYDDIQLMEPIEGIDA
ncbi:hypothetical protein HaLaN_20807, partial [Haematococcus lacustris]